MTIWLFRLLLGIDVVICLVVLVFFFQGLANGSVSAFNSGIWVAIWVALAVIIGGGLLLKAHGHTGLGTVLLLVLAVPGLLYGLFLALTMITKTSWN